MATMALPTDLMATPDTNEKPPPQSNQAAFTTPPKSAASKMHTPKSTASRGRDSRLPSASKSSVFDRLYKTQTAASKAHTPIRSRLRRNTFSSPRSKSPANMDDASKIFNRLHITGTVSNISKRRIDKTPVKHSTPRSRLHLPTTTTSPHRVSPTKNIPSRSTPLHWTPARSRGPSYVYSTRMKCLTKLYFDSKYHPGIGLETVDPIKLGYSFFQSFCDYENGSLDSKQVAREIILAFFKKDFPAGRHWTLHEPTVTERPGEENSFNVKMTAAYDWEGEHRAAFAKGVVRCFPNEKEVRVMNYVYDVRKY